MFCKQPVYIKYKSYIATDEILNFVNNDKQAIGTLENE